MSGHDAIEFSHRLDTLLPTDSGLRCSLPSEAQWEYACRAESSTPFASGETLTPELAKYAVSVSYASGPNGDDRRKTTSGGMFAANAWGCRICMATFGNGASITVMTVIAMPPFLAKLGWMQCQ